MQPALLDRWCDEVLDTVLTAERLACRFRELTESMPAKPADNAAAQEQLATLLKALGVNSAQPAPHRNRAEQMAQRLAADVPEVRQQFFEVLAQIGATVTRLLDASACRPGPFIRGGDFPPEARVFSHEVLDPAGGGRTRLAAGRIDALPAGHWLRTALPADDYYLEDDNGPHLLLLSRVGPGEFGGWPFPQWVLTTDARDLTRRYRREQRQRLDEEIGRQRLLEAAERKRREESDAGRLRAAECRIRDLEARVAALPGDPALPGR